MAFNHNRLQIYLAFKSQNWERQDNLKINTMI